MRLIGFLACIVIVLASPIFAQSDNWFFTSEKVRIGVDVSSQALLDVNGDYSVQYVRVNLSHIPYEDDRQEIQFLDVFPNAQQKNNAYFYEWTDPPPIMEYGYRSEIETKHSVVPVTTKIQFPIANLPEQVLIYTRPSEIINSDNPEVIRMASEIAHGRDDLYEVVHELGAWTKHNIQYNLSTLTADISQPSSWVLQNRQGVCDELTSLFIAMLRSLGIPARFVSGVAYTNSPLFPDNWGSHGWAEVYFPHIGWIPYDVTYGQFGYVDPTHVKLKESLDSNDPSVKYTWLGRNVNINTDSLTIDAEVLDFEGNVPDTFVITASTVKSSTGFGSYNALEVLVENTKPYYAATELFVSRPAELDMVGSTIQTVMLKPLEKKTISWLFHVDQDLNGKFVYTFPLTVSTLKNTSTTTTFTSEDRDIVYARSDIEDAMQRKEIQQQKTLSNEISTECIPSKEAWYEYEEASVECTITNKGNLFFEDLEVCFGSDCDTLDLGITQSKTFSYDIQAGEIGKQETILSLTHPDVARSDYVEYTILDQPAIAIATIEHPAEVEFDEDFEITFTLSKTSFASPQDIEITLQRDHFSKSWSLIELSDDRVLKLPLKGKNLKEGDNTIEIEVEYHDGNGKVYHEIASSTIVLSNVSLLQKFSLTTSEIFLWLGSLTIQTLLYLSFGALIVFLLVVLMVFRRGF